MASKAEGDTSRIGPAGMGPDLSITRRNLLTRFPSFFIFEMHIVLTSLFQILGAGVLERAAWGSKLPAPGALSLLRSLSYSKGNKEAPGIVLTASLSPNTVSNPYL